MEIRDLSDKEFNAYNKVVNHPLQAFEWGEFRKKTGLKVIRRGDFVKDKLVSAFQLTIHPVPHTSYNIGYLPKGELPTKELITELLRIGREEKCIFIQLEPNIKKSPDINLINYNHQIVKAAHPLFTKFTFVLDLTKSEEEILKNMHAKTRYNIKVAQKHGVEVTEDNSKDAFEEYWKLTEETTNRQGFYAHTKKYHELQWQTFKHDETVDKNSLTSHLFRAKYNGQTLTTMLFFVFHDTLYYPYGASSNSFRNTMHSTLTMWEAIRWGKKMGLKKFDMWGALGTEPDPKDSWIGFHIFKQRYGPEHVEFIGSYDLVINPLIYQLYKLADKLRWLYLRLKKLL